MRSETSVETRKPFYIAWREALGLDQKPFWALYGVGAASGRTYEYGGRHMPGALRLLIALHCTGRIDGNDLSAGLKPPRRLENDMGAHVRRVRERLGMRQCDFWPRFGVSAPTGGRCERGTCLSRPLLCMLGLYRRGRITDADLAHVRAWLATQTLSVEAPDTDTVCTAKVRPGDMYGIRWYHKERKPQGSVGGGYVVKLGRSRDNHVRWFSLAEYGDAHRALAEAQAWRDRMAADLPLISKRAFVATVRRNNTSGVAGVLRVIHRRKTASGKVVTTPRWIARSPRGQRPQLRSFTVSVHGEAGARAKAIAARRRMEAECEGFHAPHVPEAYLHETKRDDDT